MLVNLTIKRRVFILFFILLLLGLPTITYAQLKPCAVLYKTYKDNRETNPDVAYESATEFLKRCPNTDRELKKWMDAYEKGAYAPLSAQPEASPEPPRADASETQNVAADVGTGRYYALVVGNNAYQYLPQLQTAVADARVIDSILRERYGFETKLLLNAGRQQSFRRSASTGEKSIKTIICSCTTPVMVTLIVRQQGVLAAHRCAARRQRQLGERRRHNQ